MCHRQFCSKSLKWDHTGEGTYALFLNILLHLQELAISVGSSGYLILLQMKNWLIKYSETIVLLSLNGDHTGDGTYALVLKYSETIVSLSLEGDHTGEGTYALYLNILLHLQELAISAGSSGYLTLLQIKNLLNKYSATITIVSSLTVLLQ